MKIVEIYIYGYGKFENTRIANLQNQQAFFGENEAGKSTIMSFIHSILFGFPTKQQSELRYEPKKGAKYGGQIIAIFPNEGKVIIERVKGKATGDVVVTLENGMVGGEKLLQGLMSGIDKALYQSIFSFNLQGLQNVHGLKDEDIGRFLFSTSTVGSDRLLKVENELAKELDSRFKPNGRNPSLNIKLKEIQQLKKELQKAEENNEQYLQLLHTKEAIENQIKELKSSINEMTQKQTYYEEWKKVSSFFEREARIKKELSCYDDIVFPDNGMEQFDYLTQQQHESKRKLNTYQQRVALLADELTKVMPNEIFIELENEMNTTFERLPLVERWTQENSILEVKLNKIEDEIKLLQQQIHLSLTKENIFSINTSIFMRDKTSELQSRQKKLADKKRDLDEQFQEEKRRLEDFERKEAELKKELMSEEEVQRIKEKLSELETKEALSYQKKEIADKLSFLQMTLQRAEEKQKSEKKRYFLFFIIFIVLLGWGTISSVIELIIAGGMGIFFALIALIKVFKIKNIAPLHSEVNNLQKKKAALENRLELPKEQEILLKQKLEKDTSMKEKLFQLSVRLESQLESYDQVIDRFEIWEKEELQLRKELVEIGRQLQLPDEVALKYLNDAFLMIHELKGLYQEQENIQEQIKTNESLIEGVRGKIQNWSSQFLLNTYLPFQEAALQLKKNLRHELEKQIQYNEKKEQYKILQEELKVQQLEWEGICKDINQLYLSVSAQNEEQFRDFASKAEQKKILMDEWNHLSVQVKLSSFDKSEAEYLLEHFSDSLITEIANKMQHLEAQYSNLLDKLAALKYNIQLIEDGGTYAELYHHFKQLDAAFNDEAKEWVKFAAAKEILQQTIQHYKLVRLPVMLQKAEEYLYFLTGGNYRRIIPKPEGSGFIIESKEQLLFDANELSQATTEQIYVALRLALTVTIYEKYGFPLIIDDSFVNFDSERTKRVFDLLLNQRGQQILFFTCHQSHLQYFSENSIISLTN